MKRATLGEEPGFDVTKDQGQNTYDPQQIQQLEAAGWWKCPGKLNTGKPCNFWLNPQTKQRVENSSGYVTCPRCHRTTNLMEHLPWHGPQDPIEFDPGGTTKIGIPLNDQGQIGENLVAGMKEIPGYGPITWWHPGGAGMQSPLDGATSDWGIEVKTIGYDAMHHRF